MKIVHVALDIDDFLSRRRLDGLLSHADGRPMTHEEVRQDLAAWKVDGFAKRPLCPCDNFHPKRGCQGHPAPAKAESDG